MQKALVFGSGNLYNKKKNSIKAKYEIIGFLDNNPEDNGLFYKKVGIPVYNPQDKDNYPNKDDIMIILMSYEYVSMWKQLYDLGIDNSRIVFGIGLPPYSGSEKILFENERKLSIKNDKVAYHISEDKEVIIESHIQLSEIANKLLRECYRDKYPIINAIRQMNTEPVSREFGLERGTPIDRYYIEKFIEKNKRIVRGDCLEIAENTYTTRYGGNQIVNSYILHLEGWGLNSIKGNLETGEGIEENRYDCAIITQTLMFIFHVEKAAENIYKLLKRGGNALITVAGISQISRYDADLWGSYYGFHEDAMRAAFEPLFGKEHVKVETYGNVKTAMAMLCGLCQEDLSDEDFNIQDRDYPVIITVLVHKDS